MKSWLIGEDSDAGRDWGQEEKETTEDEMAGWHHRLDGHESGWTPGVGDGQGGLACCNSWGRKESDMTEWLNWTEWDWTTFNMFIGHWDISLMKYLFIFFAHFAIGMSSFLFPGVLYVLWMSLLWNMYYKHDFPLWFATSFFERYLLINRNS